MRIYRIFVDAAKSRFSWFFVTFCDKFATSPKAGKAFVFTYSEMRCNQISVKAATFTAQVKEQAENAVPVKNTGIYSSTIIPDTAGTNAKVLLTVRGLLSKVLCALRGSAAAGDDPFRTAAIWHRVCHEIANFGHICERIRILSMLAGFCTHRSAAFVYSITCKI